MRFAEARFSKAPAAILGFALTLTPSLFAQHQFPPSQKFSAPVFTPGVEFPYVGHPVADLDKSIQWFTRIQFQVVEGPTAWTVDEPLNKLGNTPGAESRSVVLKTLGTGNAPFTLVLRQYRGVPQQNWSKPLPQPPGGNTRYARELLTILGLIPSPGTGPGGTSMLGFRGTSMLEDLDGFRFSARAVDQGLRVSEPIAAITPEAAQFQDINANYASFKVDNLDAVYAQAKEAGATTVTEGGIMNYNNGRAVLLREPYAHGYIVLWQPAS